VKESGGEMEQTEHEIEELKIVDFRVKLHYVSARRVN
jgi:hypothetical protein